MANAAKGQTPDKPEGTEQHPPNVNPGRQGPDEASDQGAEPQTRPPATGEPRPEASPGEPGVTSPKQGKV
jgi:hypothetical protein